ncbi:MAG TPA: hypothetical protein VGI70_17500, partial [Polyangiales bacterium]
MIDFARSHLASLLLTSLLAACASASQPMAAKTTPPPTAAGEPVPTGRLPSAVRPLAYALDLRVFPKEERFSGQVQITLELETSRRSIWLHGKGLHVSSVKATVSGAPGAVIAGTFKQVNDDGVASIAFDKPLPAGQSVLRIDYDAPFNKQLEGLYRVDSGGES